MERLTDKREADAQRKEYENRLKNGYPRNIPEERFLKLAAYEDTGLEPEEVKEREAAYIEIMTRTYGPFRQKISQWLQAEKDGRLVVLPCKVGAYVWVDGRKAIVKEFFGYKTERYLQAQFYGNMQYVDIPFEEIGKTVFLTREEDEAALKKRGRQ